MIGISGNPLLKKAARFFIDRLELYEYNGHIHLSLNNSYDIWGSCAQVDDNEFEIVINGNAECPITTLAHEMVHVEQYLSGKMREISLTHIIWCDKVYSQAADEGSEDYWNLPWEIDARARQDELAQAFVHFLVDKGR